MYLFLKNFAFNKMCNLFQFLVSNSDPVQPLLVEATKAMLTSNTEYQYTMGKGGLASLKVLITEVAFAIALNLNLTKMPF